MKLLFSELYQLPLTHVRTYRGVKLTLFEVSSASKFISSNYVCCKQFEFFDLVAIQSMQIHLTTPWISVDQSSHRIHHVSDVDVQSPDWASLELAGFQFRDQQKGNAAKSKFSGLGVDLSVFLVIIQWQCVSPFPSPSLADPVSLFHF